jgi:deoxycytidine triphosphate deaminase
VLLTKSVIKSSGIVQYPQSNGERESTYDATVGTILEKGKDAGIAYTLPPRGVVWVISQEEFHMPNNVTALATVRTTWAHNGVFALNVGVVDPGWHGPLATALVNFSTEDFEVRQGDAFMRLVFIQHEPTTPQSTGKDRSEYVKQIKLQSRSFSKTFLSMHTLVDDVAKEIFKLPRLAVGLAVLVVTLASIFIPIAITVWTNGADMKAEVAKLQLRVEELESADKRRQDEQMSKATNHEPSADPATAAQKKTKSPHDFPK